MNIKDLLARGMEMFCSFELVTRTNISLYAQPIRYTRFRKNRLTLMRLNWMPIIQSLKIYPIELLMRFIMRRLSVKPGSCPKSLSWIITACVQECWSDNDCAGMSKCCTDGCARRCSQPITDGRNYLSFPIYTRASNGYASVGRFQKNWILFRVKCV